MENLGVVSVILPVYNVDKYLPKCLESVCNQTYPFLEIIIIDDESPDNSGVIADDFASRDERIKVLHIKNRGAAGARNVGLDTCTGDYVFFVDSDDWIEKDMIETLLIRIKEDNSDLVQCQYIDEYKKYSQKHSYIENNEVCSDKDFVFYMIHKWEYIINCNKIYTKKIIGDIRFVEGRCIDDEFFTYRVIINSNTISLCNAYLYHYRQRKSSAMGSVQKNKQRLLDQVDFVTQRFPALEKNYPTLKSSLLQHLCEVLMSVMRNGSFDEDIYNYAKRKLKKYGKYAIFNRGVSSNIKKSVLSYLFTKRDKLTVDKVNQVYTEFFD
ncbi:MAG: glycosyltransferase family 2 protein [Eubacterium sp.]